MRTESDTEVHLYSKADCVQCTATKRRLDALGIEYETFDLDTDDAALARVKALGYLAAPVVVAGDDDWSGFNPMMIDQLAKSPAA